MGVYIVGVEGEVDSQPVRYSGQGGAGPGRVRSGQYFAVKKSFGII